MSAAHILAPVYCITVSPHHIITYLRNPSSPSPRGTPAGGRRDGGPGRGRSWPSGPSLPSCRSRVTLTKYVHKQRWSSENNIKLCTFSRIVACSPGAFRYSAISHRISLLNRVYCLYLLINLYLNTIWSEMKYCSLTPSAPHGSRTRFGLAKCRSVQCSGAGAAAVHQLNCTGNCTGFLQKW